MNTKRVVITGMGAITPLGNDPDSLHKGVRDGKSAVQYMDEWKEYGLSSHLAAPAELKDEKKIPRQRRRSMGRLSIFAAQAAEQAMKDAKLEMKDQDTGRAGCIIGSTMGSANSINDAFKLIIETKDVSQLSSGMFFQCMSHTAAANVAQYLGLGGYVLSTSSACASALQAIGTGFEMISLGKQDVLLCGGAEELHPMVTGSFDMLFATSSNYNDRPHETPRPFDAERDGLVCGEGSGILVLEEYEHALRRNARIYAEIVSYSTCSGSHISQSDSRSMVHCMKETLEGAGISPEEIDYINAHATGTEQGDKEEAGAIREVFGDAVPVSSMKGHLGHTLGASGAIELILTLKMMNEGIVYPTLNLKQPGTDCSGIQHVMNNTEMELRTIMKNSFAFGGINAALICKKHES